MATVAAMLWGSKGGDLGKSMKKATEEFGKSFKKVTKKILPKVSVGIVKALMKGFDFITTIPFIPQFMDFARSLMDLGTSPSLQLLAEMLGALGAIIGVIIEPFRPFIDLLNIFAMALSAALVPLTAEIYEGLMPAFGEIIDGIPQMTQAVVDFMESAGPGFTQSMMNMGMSVIELIPKIVELLPTIVGLTLTFFNLAPQIVGLIPDLLELAMTFIAITLSLIQSGLLKELLVLSERFADLMWVMSPLVPIITNVVRVITNLLAPLSWIAGPLVGAATARGAGPVPTGSAEAIRRGTRAIHQYGGMASYTGYHHLEVGETVEPVGVGAGMGAVEIHIHGHVFGMDNLKDEIFDEYERRKRLGLI